MDFKAVPIDMISEPNTFSVLPDDRWVIEGSNAKDLWFQLNVVDSLGERRYLVPSGSTLEVIFQRADLIESQGARRFLSNETRTVTKNAVAHADDASLFKVSLTSSDVSNIVSGTVKFVLTEPSATYEWLMNWALLKKSTDPGF